MADSNESRPVVRATKPVSETLLNEKVQSTLGFSSGAKFGLRIVWELLGEGKLGEWKHERNMG